MRTLPLLVAGLLVAPSLCLAQAQPAAAPAPSGYVPPPALGEAPPPGYAPPPAPGYAPAPGEAPPPAAAASAAPGAYSPRGPFDYPSPIALSAEVGLQAGLRGYTPGGFKLVLDYTHRFARSRDNLIGVWFFADLGFVVSTGIGVCNLASGGVYDCSTIGYGSAIEIKGGIQLTFRTKYPLVPYVKLGAAIAGVFGRDRCEDTGAGVPLAVPGGGLRYFFSRHLAVSLGAEASLGPAFYSAGKDCFTGGHNEFWRAISVLGGLQYAL